MDKFQKLTSTIRLIKDTNLKPNFSALAKAYGIDRRTVKKYYENGGMPKRKKKKEFSRWDPYLDLINQKLEIPGITIRGLHEFFRETMGDSQIPGTYESLKAYIRKKDIQTSRSHGQAAHVHFETPPGQQIQVDWIEGLKLRLKSGETVPFNVYSATLGWSREHVFIYAPSITTDDFIRCTVDVFRKLGGVTKELLTDNMPALVSINGKNRRINTKAAQFFKDFGVELKLCKVRSPQTKGKDESANRFQSWLLPYDGELNDADDIRHLVDEILTRRTNNQINGTTGMPPTALFQKEKEYLKPLPHQVLLDSYLKEHEVRTVPPTLLVSYKGKGYSVPKNYIGKRVHLYACNDNLFIYDNKNELITIHSISNDKKNYHFDHYVNGLNIKGKSENEIREIAKKNLERFDCLLPETKKEKK